MFALFFCCPPLIDEAFSLAAGGDLSSFLTFLRAVSRLFLFGCQTLIRYTRFYQVLLDKMASDGGSFPFLSTTHHLSAISFFLLLVVGYRD